VSETEEPAARSCQWCGAAAPVAATTCPGCGAALGERESLGGVVVPGVTAVDPALAAFDAQPWHLPRSSPTHGMAGGSIAAVAMGGPVGIAALGGLAAVAAVEYLGAKSGDGRDRLGLDALGRPSEAALQMVQKLNAGDPTEPTAATEATDATSGNGDPDDAGASEGPR
jgi:hypothetical protein